MDAPVNATFPYNLMYLYTYIHSQRRTKCLHFQALSSILSCPFFGTTTTMAFTHIFTIRISLTISNFKLCSGKLKYDRLSTENPKKNAKVNDGLKQLVDAIEWIKKNSTEFRNVIRNLSHVVKVHSLFDVVLFSTAHKTIRMSLTTPELIKIKIFFKCQRILLFHALMLFIRCFSPKCVPNRKKCERFYCSALSFDLRLAYQMSSDYSEHWIFSFFCSFDHHFFPFH